MPISWRRFDSTLYASATSDDGDRYHLIVEPLANDPKWDWSVWQPNRPVASALHGVAPSEVRAAADAERAAKGRLTPNYDPR